MSALTEQVAREHRAQEVLSRLSDREGRRLYVGCTCGVGPLSALSHAAHIAAVTERMQDGSDMPVEDNPYVIEPEARP